MKKVLIFPYSNQLGTTIPSITLANLLKKNGYKVEYASRGKYTFVIEEKGFKTYDVPEISYMHYRENLNNNRMDYYAKDALRIMVDYELDLINQVDPDIVVGHNRPSLYISTKLADIKYVNLTIASLTKYFDQPIYIPDNHPLNRYFPFDINNILPSAIPKFVYNLTLESFATGFNKNLKYFGLNQVESYLDLSEADLVLLTETYGLVKMKPLPKNYIFLEQNIKSCFGKEPKWLSDIAQAKKEGKYVIFLNMGTSSFESYPLVLQTIAEFVIKNKEYCLISNYCGLEKFYKTRERMYIEKFIEPSSVLDYVDLVVTHGGKNTLNETVLAKKKIIGIPEQVEQLWNLKYIESLGMAKVLSRFKLKKNPKSIIPVMMNLLANKDLDKTIQNKVDIMLHGADIEDRNLLIVKAFNRII